MMPHLAEECWSMMMKKNALSEEPWPEVNEEYTVQSSTTIVIQINGKRRGELNAKIGITENEVMEEIMSIKNISETLKDKEIKKVIFVKDKIINLVI